MINNLENKVKYFGGSLTIELDETFVRNVFNLIILLVKQNVKKN